MQKFSVTGMSCAACQARVEKAVADVGGVTACSVNLLTGRMIVDGRFSDAEVIRAVRNAGYDAAALCPETEPPREHETPSPDAALSHEHNSPSPDAAPPGDLDTHLLRRRLLSSLLFLLPLLYVSMGCRMLRWPLPSFFDGNPASTALLQLLLCIVVLIINRKFFISGAKGILHRAPNMDTLVALGSCASFLWSLVVLFGMTDTLIREETEAAAHALDSLYFDSAAMILVLITVGKMLEARSKGRTTDALRSLMSLAPRTAVLWRDGTESTVPIEDVRVGDIFLVRSGAQIPVDGVILEGSASIDESALTGESLPVDKTVGDTVSQATINRSGYLRAEATRIGKDTTLAQIIELVENATTAKAPIARTADRVSAFFVPTVLGLSLLTLVVWLILRQSFAMALERAVSVLVISCPCALGLATPVAIMVGSGRGARRGILFKSASALEETGRIRILALDKTGTLTEGAPHVTDLLPCENISDEELLEAACSLEARSEHPLAQAILQTAFSRAIMPREISQLTLLAGRGLSALCEGCSLIGGSVSFMRTQLPVPSAWLRKAQSLADQGRTPLLFARDGQLLGMIALADPLKNDSAEAIRALQQLGLAIVMVTGDNERTAQAIARSAGIRHCLAGVLPQEKADIVRRLQSLGKVAMVGDGINDAPALACSDVGIAVGAGTDVAIDSASVVLMNSRLSDVTASIRLSRAVLRCIHQNLFWAFLYNCIGIPLAAGCFIGLLGWQLSPMFGAAAMSLSSFCVVINALRLNLFQPDRDHRDRRSRSAIDDAALDALLERIRSEKEDFTMKKVLKVEGMMCVHCEARVRKALEALDGVESAMPSHVSGTVEVTLSTPVENEVLMAAVEAQDYTVTAMADA